MIQVTYNEVVHKIYYIFKEVYYCFNYIHQVNFNNFNKNFNINFCFYYVSYLNTDFNFMNLIYLNLTIKVFQEHIFFNISI